jgi:hypothetical protein
MNIRMKSAVYIVFTFLVGVAVGILLNRALLQKKINDMLVMRASGRIVPRLEEIVKPENPEQWTSIRKILDKHEGQMAGIHLRFREEIEAAFKSLKADLDPLLTAEQKSRLEDMLPKPPPFFRQAPGRFGLPPGRGLSVEEELSFLVEGLGLSPEQTDKVKAVLNDYASRIESQMKKAWRPGEAPPFIKLLEERNREIEKILTPEQADKLKAMRPGNPKRPGMPPPPGPQDAPEPF